VAYKPNTAFYEALGPNGWASLEKTIAYIPDTHLTIADAKRGDIGNTSELYARAFFEQLNCDAVTVAPYMGSDSVQPFLAFEGKYVVLLALTSNKGSADFQFTELVDGQPLYEQVLRTSSSWANADRLMYLVGATQTEHLAHIRALVPHHFLLVPGVGAQGGSLEAVSRHGMNSQCGLLVNASRSIIYADNGPYFARHAAQAAQALQQQMGDYLQKYI